MVCLDVDLYLILQAEPLEEAVDGLRVEIILVLRRLVRLGLDEDRAGEADLVFVLDDQAQKTPEIVLLDRDIGVEDRVIAFATVLSV